MVVIETVHDNKTEWGVSFTDHNPLPQNYYQCRSRGNAFALANGTMQCPKCGSTKLIPPGKSFPCWTCDPCGTDFNP